MSYRKVSQSIPEQKSPSFSSSNLELEERYVAQGKKILQPHHLLDRLIEVLGENDELQTLKDGLFGDVLRSTQEAIILPPWIVVAVRPRPGVWDYVRVNVDELAVEQLSMAEYLNFKEQLVDESVKDKCALDLDLEPFNESFPHPTRASSIGSGVQFLNRYLSSRLFHDRESVQPLPDFLRAHNYSSFNSLITCCTIGLRNQPSHHNNFRFDFQSLMFYSQRHFILQCTNLIKYIHNLSTSIWHS